MGGRDPCLPVGDAPSSSLQIQVCLVLEQCAPTSLFQRFSGPVAIVWDMWRVLPALSHVTRLSRERTRCGPPSSGSVGGGRFCCRGRYGCMFLRRSSREGSNFSPIISLTDQHPHGPAHEFGQFRGIRHPAHRRIASGPYRMGGYALPRGYAKRAAHPRP